MSRFAGVIALTLALGLMLPPPVSAVPNGCIQQPWLIVLRMTMRTICDGPLMGDGSWWRRRMFYAPETYVPISCSRYSCVGGYWLDEYVDVEEYIVTPATVLPDEPGWVRR